MMSHIENMLKKSLDVVNLDLPLHGKNMMPLKELSIGFCKEYVESLLLQQKKPDVSLIGYSDGANVAAELCGSPSLHVNKCFLISPNTHYSGMKWQWLWLFRLMRAISFSLRSIKVFNIQYQRMGMIVNYEMDTSIKRSAGEFRLYYARDDMFKIQDQVKMEEILGVQRIVVDNTNHMNILYSDEIKKEVEKIFL